MDSTDTLPSGSLGQTLSRVMAGVMDNIPSIIVALLVIVGGWLLARLARRTARQVATVANRFLDRAYRRGSVAGVRMSLAFVTVAGEVAYWLVLILALILAAGMVGIGSIGQWLNQIVIHLPSVIVGAVIIVVGYFFSVYLREAVASSARDGEIRAPGAIGRLVQGAAMTIAVIIGLDQAGVEVGVLKIAVAIVGGGLAVGVVVAFAAGARDHVGNLIGARNARHFLQPGVRVRIADVEGEILEISATHVALDTAEGKTMIPAATLETHRVVIVTPTPEGQSGNG